MKKDVLKKNVVPYVGIFMFFVIVFILFNSANNKVNELSYYEFV